jgi:hypothetical protein
MKSNLSAGEFRTEIGVPVQRLMLYSVLGAIRRETEALPGKIEQIRLSKRTIIQLHNDQVAICRYLADRMPGRDFFLLSQS